MNIPSKDTGAESASPTDQAKDSNQGKRTPLPFWKIKHTDGGHHWLPYVKNTGRTALPYWKMTQKDGTEYWLPYVAHEARPKGADKVKKKATPKRAGTGMHRQASKRAVASDVSKDSNTRSK